MALGKPKLVEGQTSTLPQTVAETAPVALPTTGTDTGRMQDKEPNTAAAPKTAPKAKASAPMSKEDYWGRREERDIETGKRIRRSGVWQASVQSMASLQFNQGGTLDSFLELVDKVAERGLTFVNKD